MRAAAVPAVKVPVLTLPPSATLDDASPALQTGQRATMMTPRCLGDIITGKKTVAAERKRRRPGWVWLSCCGKIQRRTGIKAPLPYSKIKPLVVGLTLASAEALTEALPPWRPKTSPEGRVHGRTENIQNTKQMKEEGSKGTAPTQKARTAKEKSSDRSRKKA
jgi:hypothetical protein